MCVCIHVYMYTCIHVCIYIYIHMCIYIYIHIYVCVYIYIYHAEVDNILLSSTIGRNKNLIPREVIILLIVILVMK